MNHERLEKIIAWAKENPELYNTADHFSWVHGQNEDWDEWADNHTPIEETAYDVCGIACLLMAGETHAEDFLEELQEYVRSAAYEPNKRILGIPVVPIVALMDYLDVTREQARKLSNVRSSNPEDLRLIAGAFEGSATHLPLVGE